MLFHSCSSSSIASAPGRWAVNISENIYILMFYTATKQKYEHSDGIFKNAGGATSKMENIRGDIKISWGFLMCFKKQSHKKNSVYQNDFINSF